MIVSLQNPDIAPFHSMLFQLILLLISELPVGMEARPLLLSNGLSIPGTHLPALQPNGIMDNRSTTDIVWSCLATILACTWVSLHPNIPGPREGKGRVFLSRMELMLWSIIVPEMIILWALRQRRGARHIAQKYAGLSSLRISVTNL